MLRLDHIAIAAETLESGADWVSQVLGVPLQPGGRHLRYGTHNKLLGLGPDLYLEVITRDPDAAPLVGPRWFDLDNFAGLPRLANWICQTDDMPQFLAQAPSEVGPAHELQRDALRWQITVPDDGGLPFGGGYPTVIEWGVGVPHPASRLPESGCRLLAWEVIHPQAEMLRETVPISNPLVQFVQGDAPRFRAVFDTPNGRVTL